MRTDSLNMNSPPLANLIPASTSPANRVKEPWPYSKNWQEKELMR